MQRLHFTVYIFVLAIFLAAQPILGQSVPTISPSFFTPATTITVTYDVTGSQLSALTDAYIWVWIPGANIDAKYNVNPASSNPTLTANAKFTKQNVAGRTLFSITFKPIDFFTTDITSLTRMGMLLKGDAFSGTNPSLAGQTQDYLADFWDGTYQLRLTAPIVTPVFVNNGQQIIVSAETSQASSFELFVNNVSVNASVTNSTTYTHTFIVAQASGSGNVRLVASTGGNTKERSFLYILRGSTVAQARPAGVVSGINYQADPSKVILCLLAPLKNSVFVRGDFNNWEITSDYQLKKDGEFFWIELDGLTAGQEYAFQYLVDETIVVADPYADKILDPDDQFIPANTYPNLKPFPAKVLSSKWYENRASVFQTAQVPYVWQSTNFEKPKKESLVIYELLIRDLFDNQHRNYQSLIDTLGYLKRLGINAIQLMPIMEFNGNEGWGYNPTFMFAPDKYYGTKNKLKELVDKCHQQGMAVILDIAMNHQDVPNTYAAMYFNFSSFTPAADNPWFNTTPKHPFNVFFDMNHESTYTKQYLDSINRYWLEEYRVDGYRFDLSKGFTQKNSGSDVGGWSAYDQSRVNLLTRMADKIWEHTPDAYVILEHLGENSEERVLAEYRAAEGKGMMLWGKMTEQYNQNTMGYNSSNAIGGIYHKNRSWSTPGLVGYMESHDEERLMFKNITFGNSATASHNVKDLDIGLKRMEAAFASFITIPGPKMIWQFGELGYDYSINRCPDGSIKEDCRLAVKPLAWEYREDEDRAKLFDKVSDLLRLRSEYSVFSNGDVTFNETNGLMKAITIKNKPFTNTPANAGQMNVQIVSNFDVTQRTISVTFPHAGTWYDYTHGGMPYEVDEVPSNVTLNAGRYFLFTDVPIASPVVTDISDELGATFSIYPNPTSGMLSFTTAPDEVLVFDIAGKRVSVLSITGTEYRIEATAGLYVVRARIGNIVHVRKVLVN